MAAKFPPFSFLDRQGRRIEVREAEERDAATVLAYLALVDRESDNLSREPGESVVSEASERIFLRQCADRPRGVFLSAWHAGQLVACLDLLPPTRQRMAHTGEFGMTVRKAFWGAGIGKALLSAVLAWTGGLGLRVVKLRVVADNASAIALYRSLGFEAWGFFREDMRLKGDVYKDVLLMGRRVGLGTPPLPLRPEIAEALHMPGGAWPTLRRPREEAPTQGPQATLGPAGSLGEAPSPSSPNGPALDLAALFQAMAPEAAQGQVASPVAPGPSGPRSPQEASVLAAVQQLAGEGAQVFLYGSRARGTESPASDWDLVAFTPSARQCPERHLGFLHEGMLIDLFIEGDEALHGPAREPDLRLLGGRWLAQGDGPEGPNYLARLAALEAMGPSPWSAEELELHRRWVGKMLGRMARAEEDVEDAESLLRRAEFLAEALGLYERVRGRWQVGPAKGMARLKREAPADHAVFLAALKPSAGLPELEALAQLILAPVGGPLA